MKRFFSRYGLIFVIAIAWLIVGYKCAAGQTPQYTVVTRDCSGTILEWANCVQGCEPGYTVMLLSDTTWTECRPDPVYWTWDYVYHDFRHKTYIGLRRVDSMWTMHIDTIADTVPVWREARLLPAWNFDDTLKVWPRWQSASGDTIQNFLVQVGDIRYRVDTTYTPVERKP